MGFIKYLIEAVLNGTEKEIYRDFFLKINYGYVHDIELYFKYEYKDKKGSRG